MFFWYAWIYLFTVWRIIILMTNQLIMSVPLVSLMLSSEGSALNEASLRLWMALESLLSQSTVCLRAQALSLLTPIPGMVTSCPSITMITSARPYRFDTHCCGSLSREKVSMLSFCNVVLLINWYFILPAVKLALWMFVNQQDCYYILVTVWYSIFTNWYEMSSFASHNWLVFV